MPPPERESRPAGNEAASDTAADGHDSNAGFEVAAYAFGGGGLADPAMQRRRECAVRTPEGDPLQPSTRYHRPTIGHQATGFRDGYVSCLKWVLGELRTGPVDLVIAKLDAILSRGDDE